MHSLSIVFLFQQRELYGNIFEFLHAKALTSLHGAEKREKK